MADSCSRCGSDNIVHEYRPLVRTIDVICSRCRHCIRIIFVKEAAEQSRKVREELVISAESR